MVNMNRILFPALVSTILFINPFFAIAQIPKFHIDTSNYAKQDKDYEAHKTARKSKNHCFPDRELIFFTNGEYTVITYDSDTALLYNRKGKLRKIIISDKPLLRRSSTPINYYPYAMFAYTSNNGALKYKVVKTSYDSYNIESAKGESVGSCFRDICLNPEGNFMSKRSFNICP